MRSSGIDVDRKCPSVNGSEWGFLCGGSAAPASGSLCLLRNYFNL